MPTTETPSSLLSSQIDAMWGDETDGPSDSLWAQLNASIGRASEEGGGGGLSSRSTPPISTAVLSLIEEIRLIIAGRWNTFVSEAIEYMQATGKHFCAEPPAHRQPEINARRLAKRLEGWPREQLDLAHLIQRWVDQANRMLGNTQSRLTHVREHPCNHCGEWYVTVRDGADKIRQPVLRVVWVGKRIVALDCANCGHIYPATGAGLAILRDIA